jgi:chorismate mutase
MKKRTTVKKRPGIKGRLDQVQQTAENEMKRTGAQARHSINEVEQAIVNILTEGVEFSLEVGSRKGENNKVEPGFTLPVKLKLKKIGV